MEEKQANSLVTKLVNAAYEAGMHSTNPKSLFVESFKTEGKKLLDEIVHHLTNQTSEQDIPCALCGTPIESSTVICRDCRGEP